VNLLLLFPDDFIGENIAQITGRRFQHLKKIIKVNEGQTLAVGKLNSELGIGFVNEIEKDSLTLRTEFSSPPPTPSPVTLLLALPRPLMLKRILQSISSLGVKNIYLIQSNKVEKSFWNSSDLEPEIIQQQLTLGLEQAKDTVMPEVHFKRRFKAFVEDEIPAITHNKQALLADIGDYPPCPANCSEETVLAIGPEGGFTEFESQLLIEKGFSPVQLGERVLRVETAVSCLLGRLLHVPG